MDIFLDVDPIQFGRGDSAGGRKTVVTLADAQTLTNKTLSGAIMVGSISTPISYSADGAISIASQHAIITKAGSACLLSLAAPGAAGVGVRILVTSNSDFAHVITFTGGTLWDGTTGANTTVTMTAFKGSSIVVIAASATIWLVESQNVLTSIA
jgi:hypothetical protein